MAIKIIMQDVNIGFVIEGLKKFVNFNFFLLTRTILVFF